MDPSAAPWRVIDAGDAPATTGGMPTSAPAPSSPGLAISVSPLTIGAAAGVLVLAVAAFVFAASDVGGGTVRVDAGTSLAPVGGVAGAGGSDTAGVGPTTDEIVVEIVGAIRKPGVFRLPIGARVGDLVEAAGGYGPRLDAARAGLDLNLAARLADGDRVVVPSRDDVASSTSGTAGGASDGTAGGASDGTASASGGTTLVDVNRATQAELEALPGIGPVTAGKIIASREERPFATVDDLRARKLVGAKTFDGLKDLVTVR
jgi:competence protein ComEA